MVDGGPMALGFIYFALECRGMVDGGTSAPPLQTLCQTYIPSTGLTDNMVVCYSL